MNVYNRMATMRVHSGLRYKNNIVVLACVQINLGITTPLSYVTELAEVSFQACPPSFLAFQSCR